jgi:hypothetical protein
LILRAESMTVGSSSLHIVRKDDLITMKWRAAADPARHKTKALRDTRTSSCCSATFPIPTRVGDQTQTDVTPDGRSAHP